MTAYTQILPLGSVLDTMIAEKVFGWERLVVGYFGLRDSETPRQVELEGWLDELGVESVGEYFIDVPSKLCISVDERQFSTSMAAAWLVVEKMCADGWSWESVGGGALGHQSGWRAHFYKYPISLQDSVDWPRSGDAPTMPHAICIAALRVIDYEPPLRQRQAR